MRKTKIEFVLQADLDLEAIDDYYYELNRDVAAAFDADVKRAIRRLSVNPFSAPAYEDQCGVKTDFRKMMLLYGYFLLYKVNDNTVSVYRVMNGKQNITPNMLKGNS